MLNFLRGLAISRKFVVRVVSALREHDERLDRLEIAVKKIEAQQLLDADLVNRLGKRLAGRQGGRPVSHSETPNLDDVPKGDKAGLRRALAGMKHN